MAGFDDILDMEGLGRLTEIPKINPRFLTSRNRSLETHSLREGTLTFDLHLRGQSGISLGMCSVRCLSATEVEMSRDQLCLEIWSSDKFSDNNKI